MARRRAWKLRASSRRLLPVKTFEAGRAADVMTDNMISARPAVAEDHPGVRVVLVSKDINLRIKASICNITAEDYENDRAIDDFNLLFTGATELPTDFWEKHEGSLRSWTEKGRTYYEVKRQPDDGWYANQFLYLPGDDEVELKSQARREEGVCCRLSTIRSDEHQVWGQCAQQRAELRFTR